MYTKQIYPKKLLFVTFQSVSLYLNSGQTSRPFAKNRTVKPQHRSKPLTGFVSASWVTFKVLSFPSLPSGHEPALPLPRPVGRQLLHGGRVPAAHLPAVPHLRALHPLRVHPRARLLRPAGGLPRTLPPGGQRPRQVGPRDGSLIGMGLRKCV